MEYHIDTVAGTAGYYLEIGAVATGYHIATIADPKESYLTTGAVVGFTLPSVQLQQVLQQGSLLILSSL